MQAVRLRTLTAVAAIVLAAGGVATGSAVATRGPSTPVGPELEVDEAVIRAVDLYPTSSANPDPEQVAHGVLDLEGLGGDGDGADGPVRLVAQCTCEPGTPEAEQFENLVIRVQAKDGAELYEGPLTDLAAGVVDAEKTIVKVWLADTGMPQPQGVVTEFSFVATSEG